MASNTQQFRIRGASTNKPVNEVGVVDNLRMENQLIELTSLVRQLVVSQHQEIPQVKNSRVQQEAKTTPLPFPSQTISGKKIEIDEELLKMFRRVEINIPLLDAMKQIPRYAKFLKELCIHKRNKLKEGAEVGGVLSTFIQKEVTAGTKPALPRKCRDPRIFSVPCTIGCCTFADAMLDLGALIYVMPASMYKYFNFGDLELIEPIGILEDVLIQVNYLIFPTNFYVLEMEDETFGKGSTLILGWPFQMTARTKIDVHVGTFSMEFGANLVQFNIFDAIRHPTKDHSLYSMDLIDKLVNKYNQFDSDSSNMTILVEISNMLEGTGSVMGDAGATRMNGVLNRPNSGNHKQTQAKTDPVHLIPTRPTQPRSITDSFASQSPPNELRSLPRSVVPGHYSQQPQIGTRREIADSPSVTQEINRVETFRPSRNQSLYLHA
ncbi:hypothetical protein CR513_35414, partial [Mucuna pruriens]